MTDLIDSKGQRKFFSIMLVGSFFLTLLVVVVCAKLGVSLDQSDVWGAWSWVAGVLAFSVTGETVRPSGSAVAAIGGTRAAPVVVAPTGDEPVVNVEAPTPPSFDKRTPASQVEGR